MSEARSAAPTDAAALVDKARAGDRRSLARLLTEVENRTAAGEQALRQLYPQAGRAHLVGVTGAPGCGQVHARCRNRWRRAHGRPASGGDRHRSLLSDHRRRDPG